MTDDAATREDLPRHARQGTEESSAELFRALLQHANDLVYSVAIDPDERMWSLEFLSDRIRDLSGYPPEAFIEGGELGTGGPFGLKDPEEHPFELLHPGDLERTMKATRALSAGQRVTREYRIRNHETGEFRWVEDRSEPEKDEQGRVVRIWGIVRDVTERRKREEALGRLAAIVAASDDAILGLDLEGKVLTWNPAAEALYGYSEKEMLGNSFFELVAPTRARALNDVVRSLGPGPFKEDDAFHYARDGRAIPISLTMSATAGSEERPGTVAVVVRDVTERRRLELELVHSQKMEAIGRLAGGIAHDFNNILTVILGQSETVLEELAGHEGHPVTASIKEIHQAASRAAALTTRLLTFSRKQLLQPTLLELHTVVDDMEDMLQRLLGDDVEMDLRTERTSVIEADITQVQQVLLNLAVNAREAMPTGGRIEVETRDVELDQESADRLRGARPGSWVMLSVTDTGSGIDSQVLEHIFEPFFTTKQHGTGLGLSTVYGIVTQSGGCVAATSTPEGGTTFKVFLPRAGGV